MRNAANVFKQHQLKNKKEVLLVVGDFSRKHQEVEYKLQKLKIKRFYLIQESLYTR